RISGRIGAHPSSTAARRDRHWSISSGPTISQRSTPPNGRPTMGLPEDVSPRMHDPRTQASFDHASRNALEEDFHRSVGTATEKIENFAKHAPRQNLARFLARYEIFRLIKENRGSIVECGVQFGGGLMSFAKLSAILEPYNFQRRIIGFDTFTDFPTIDRA